jgi:hypothetical protein
LTRAFLSCLSFSFLRSDMRHLPTSVFSRSPGTPRTVVKTSFPHLLLALCIRLRAPFCAFKEHRVFLLSFLRSQGAPRRILSLSSLTPACPRISGRRLVLPNLPFLGLTGGRKVRVTTSWAFPSSEHIKNNDLCNIYG